VDCGVRASSPAHSAAWHVGPEFGDLASPAAPRRSRESNNSFSLDKKMGCPSSTPKVKAENYRFFAAFFFPPLAFFAIVFSSGCCDSASDDPFGRHYGWAEPSTLIPDV